MALPRGKAPSVSHRDFFTKLKSDIEKGYGLVPFIGSGISSASGIMVGPQFATYLSYVLYRTLASPGAWYVEKDGWPPYPGDADIEETRVWLLERIGKIAKSSVRRTILLLKPAILPAADFLEAIASRQSEQALADLESAHRQRVQKDYQKHTSSTARQKHPQAKARAFTEDRYFHAGSGKRRVEWISICTMYHWVSMLVTISRLRFKKDQQTGSLIYYLENAPNNDVIDSFNTYICRDKKPSLGHMSLAYLSQNVEIQALLTTNFDPLLEDAFKEIQLPLNVIPVEKDSPIPDVRTILQGRTLIKLHGSLSQTRADYSLYTELNPDEIEKINQYGFTFKAELHGRVRYRESIMLVLGSGMADARSKSILVGFLKQNFESQRIRDGQKFKLYVVGYVEDDTERMYREICEELKEFASRRQMNGLMLFTRTTRLDLFLYEMNVAVTEVLPSGGFLYQVNPYMPAQYVRATTNYKALTKPITRILRAVLKGKHTDSNAGAYKHMGFVSGNANNNLWVNTERFPPEVFGVKGEYLAVGGKNGVQAFASLLFNLVSKVPFQTIWVDIDYSLSLSEVLSDIIRQIAFITGRYYLRHVNHDFDKDVFDEAGRVKLQKILASIIDVYRISPSNWFVFVNARNALGSSSYWAEPNEQEEESEPNPEMEEICRLLASSNFRVVHIRKGTAPKFVNNKRNRVTTTNLDDYIKALTNTRAGELVKLQVKGNHSRLASSLVFEGSRHVPYRGAKSQLIYYLLYATTFFSRSMQVPSIYAGIAHPNSWEHTKDLFSKGPGDRTEVKSIIELISNESARYLCEKQGGFLWAAKKRRKKLQDRLEGEQKLELVGKYGKTVKLQYGLIESKAVVLFWISEWFLRRFNSSNHAALLFEAIRYKIQSIKNIHKAIPIDFRNRTKRPKNRNMLYLYRVALLNLNLATIIKTLLISRHSMRYWMYGVHSAYLLDWNEFGRELFPGKSPTIEPGAELQLGEKWLNQVLGGNSEAPHDESFRNLYVNSYSWNYFDGLIRLLKDELYKLRTELQREGGIVRVQKSDSINQLATSNHYIGNMTVESVNYNINVDVPYYTWEAYENSIYPGKDLAQKHFLNILRDGINNFTSIPEDEETPEDEEQFFAEMRRFKLLVNENFQFEQARFFSLVYFISELVYVFVIRAKFCRRCANSAKGLPEHDPPAEIEQVNIPRLWRVAGVLARLTQELVLSLHPRYLATENNLKVKALTLGGLALARLDRLEEARDMLSHANALTYRLPLRDSINERAIVRIRMAEVSLVEAQTLKSQLRKVRASERFLPKYLDLYRRHIAKLDNTVSSLDAAEHLLEGNSHSSLWWGRLYYLRMRVFAEHYVFQPREFRNRDKKRQIYVYKSRVYRRNKNYIDYISNLLRSGLLVSRDDPYRKLSLIDIYVGSILNYVLLQRSFGVLLGERDDEERTNDSCMRLLLAFLVKLRRVLTNDIHAVDAPHLPKGKQQNAVKEGTWDSLPETHELRAALAEIDWSALMPSFLDFRQQAGYNRSLDAYRANIVGRLVKVTEFCLAVTPAGAGSTMDEKETLLFKLISRRKLFGTTRNNKKSKLA